MAFQLVNNLRMILGVALNPGDTTLTVLDDNLPQAERYDPVKQLAVTLVDPNNLDNYEIIYLTARTGTTFNCLRGQEDTVATSWPGGTPIIATLTYGVLQSVIAAPTGAIAVSYDGGSYAPAGNVEGALDTLGDAVLSNAAGESEYAIVRQRLGAIDFAGGALNNVNVKWSGGNGGGGAARRYTTAGLGVAVTDVATIVNKVIGVPDLVVAVRSSITAKIGTIRVTAYNNAAPTNSALWNLDKTKVQAGEGWTLFSLPAMLATTAGDLDNNPADRIEFRVQDDATGATIVDLNFVDIVAPDQKRLRFFKRCSTGTHFLELSNFMRSGVGKGFAIITYEDFGTISWPAVRQAVRDGCGILVTSTANFKAQTAAQVRATLNAALKACYDQEVRPIGFVYPSGYNGPLDLDVNTTILSLVAEVYKCGYGVNNWRGPIENYRYDRPLYVAADSTDATNILAANDLSINIDVSTLTGGQMVTVAAATRNAGTWWGGETDRQPQKTQWVPVAHINLAVAAASIIVKDLGEYAALRIKANLKVATLLATVNMQFSVNNGAAWLSAAGEYKSNGIFDGSPLGAIVSATSQILNTSGANNAAGAFIDASINIDDWNAALRTTGDMRVSAVEQVDVTYHVEDKMFSTVTAQAMNAIKFQPSSGNLAVNSWIMVEGLKLV
jgi:hypothetical protein